jgi:hypothetical protein
LAQAPNAACCRSQFIHFLSAPDVLELLAAAPQVGRPMRGLCRMLGIKLDPNLVPPALIPPPRPPRRKHRVKLPSSFPGSFSRHPSREQESSHAAPCADPADDPESAALVQHILRSGGLRSAGAEPATNAARTLPQIRPRGRLPPDPDPAAFAPASHRLKPA